ncbi:MAG: HEAT repeat domain-containing protein [Pseudomonadota bacterium]
MRSTSRLLIVTAAVLSTLGCGARESSPGSPAPEVESRAAAPEDEPEPVSQLEEVVKSQPPEELPQKGAAETVENRGVEAPPTGEGILDLLDLATERQSCNRVMGCDAGDALIRRGAAAAGPIMARYGELSGWSYQRIHLLELLGRIGAAESAQFLIDQLEAPSWDARSQAAIALGRMGAKEHLGLLRAALGGVDETDRGFQYALAFSVETLGGIDGKEILVAALEGDRVANTNWGYTAIAAAAVGELGVGEACPLLVHSLRHRDIFLIKAALASAATLRCRELTPEFRKLLESEVPSIRREAARALAAIEVR